MILDYTVGNQIQFAELVQMLSNLDEGDYYIDIKKKRKLASMKQRGYYHGVICLAIACFLGWETEEVHNHIKETYNPKERMIRGQKRIIGGSTSNFNTKQYTELIDKVRNGLLQELYADGMEYVPVPQEVTNEYIVRLKNTYENRFHT